MTHDWRQQITELARQLAEFARTKDPAARVAQAPGLTLDCQAVLAQARAASLAELVDRGMTLAQAAETAGLTPERADQLIRRLFIAYGGAGRRISPEVRGDLLDLFERAGVLDPDGRDRVATALLGRPVESAVTTISLDEGRLLRDRLRAMSASNDYAIVVAELIKQGKDQTS